MQLLYDCDWPGNVRQLANVLERAAIVSSGDVLTAADIHRALDGPTRRLPATEAAGTVSDTTGNLRDTLQDMERNMASA